jgi:hypothetical protein
MRRRGAQTTRFGFWARSEDNRRETVVVWHSLYEYSISSPLNSLLPSLLHLPSSLHFAHTPTPHSATITALTPTHTPTPTRTQPKMLSHIVSRLKVQLSIPISATVALEPLRRCTRRHSRTSPTSATRTGLMAPAPPAAARKSDWTRLWSSPVVPRLVSSHRPHDR